MSAKCLDQQGRWRNKVVAFRMSPEEDNQTRIYYPKIAGKRSCGYRKSQGV